MIGCRCYTCHVAMSPTSSGACGLCDAVISIRRDVAFLVIKLGCLARPLWRSNLLADVLGTDADSIVRAAGVVAASPLDVDAALGLPPGSFASAVEAQIAVLRAQRGLIAARG